MDLSTLSYDQMNEHYLFGHFTQVELMLPEFGQFLGHPKFAFWIGFLHQSCAIMCLISCSISLAQIKPMQLKL